MNTFYHFKILHRFTSELKICCNKDNNKIIENSLIFKHTYILVRAHTCFLFYVKNMFLKGCYFWQLRDGETYDSPLIGKYCGTRLPPPIMSSNRYLYAHFVSDASVAHNGFRLEYVTNGKLGDDCFRLLYSQISLWNKGWGYRSFIWGVK